MSTKLIALGLAAMACAASGCIVQVIEADPMHNMITTLSPRCVGVNSCLLGYVTNAGTDAPIADAAVFLERESEQGDDEPIRILSLTDEQGVFIIDEPPLGSYRIAVYKGDSSVEVTGMELGSEGTTILPVRLTTQ